MTRIVLARHGESEWHRADRYVGVSDIGLTERGEAQALELGQWAQAQGFTAIVASPLRRCQATAAAAGASTGLGVGLDQRLVELDFGLAEGKSRPELERDFPQQYRAFVTDPVAHHFPDGEDPRTAARRFVAALREIAAARPEQRVLVVAHATVTRLALCDLLGVELARYRQVFPKLANGAITEITLDAESAGLLCLNVPLGVQGDTA